MIHIRHRFTAFKVMPMERGIVTRAGVLKDTVRPVTDVYERCTCGKSRIREVEGRWTLDEINPEGSLKETN